MAVRFKAWVCGRSSTGISVSNPAAGMGFVSCQVEIPASGLSPVQRSPTESSVSVCNREASILTLNLLTTTIVAPPSNASKWQMGFNL